MAAQLSGVWARLARRVVQMRGDYLVASLDIALTSAAFISALVLRFEGRVPGQFWRDFWVFLAIAVGITVLTNLAFGLYGKLWRHASVHEARRLAGAAGTVALLLFIVEQIDRRTPYSVILTGVLGSYALMSLVRFQSRLFSFRRSDGQAGLRVVVIGSRAHAGGLIRQMKDGARAGFVPVAAVDVDRAVVGKSLSDVEVAGTVSELADVIRRFNAHLAVLAIPDASHELVQLAAQQAETAGVPLKIVPPMADTMRVGVSLRELRNVNIEDLLGRQQVSTNLDSVRAMLAGQTVLITGAGGSIGSEIARQALTAGPRKVVMLDHDETHLHDIAGELTGPFEVVLADIRHRDRIHAVFAEHRPGVVFHAAAHKHVPVLETFPLEAAYTNVLGTANVLEAAIASGTPRFVLISTDKAVRPSSVMGASKRVCEQLLVDRTPAGSAFCAVRFGNVVGSRGSVIPTFVKQIEAGGPVTVTDPRMTRYFMTIPEAVQLVLQAATMSRADTDAEVFMLDMGEPVNIKALAERMIRLSGRIPGKDVEIHITGIRPGEKLAEELSAANEQTAATEHPSISRLTGAVGDAAEVSIGLAELKQCVADLDGARCKEVLTRMVAEAAPATPSMANP